MFFEIFFDTFLFMEAELSNYGIADFKDCQSSRLALKKGGRIYFSFIHYIRI